ncbi:fumarate hydratase [bacterium]|nr:fumarate hydratase [bacterium]
MSHVAGRRSHIIKKRLAIKRSGRRATSQRGQRVSREINVKKVTEVVRYLCIRANTELPRDVIRAFKKAIDIEESQQGKEVLKQLIQNAHIASRNSMPLCQDTGLALVFLEIGQEVKFVGGSLEEAIVKGVSEGYTAGFLRKSMIKNPLTNPKNSEDNTPAIIHEQIVEGDRLKITVVPKGGGGENMSRLKMLKPADGVEGVKKFVVETVELASANPCPPVIVGVGVGGSFEKVAYLAKKALLRDIGQRNPDKKIAELERKWLKEINNLGIGPAGLGGRVTALDLSIEEYPRHMATLPVAVNMECHAHRHKSYVI